MRTEHGVSLRRRFRITSQEKTKQKKTSFTKDTGVKMVKHLPHAVIGKRKKESPGS